MFAIYSHGTHVAESLRGEFGDPAGGGRITFDYHNVPLPPSEELSRRAAEDDQKYVDWFKKNHIRVVNMSWAADRRTMSPHSKERHGQGRGRSQAIAAKLLRLSAKACTTR